MGNAVAGTVTLIVVLQSAGLSRAEDKVVRKELQAVYSRIAAADQKCDIAAYIAQLTPDFKHKYRLVKFETPESIQNEFAMRSKSDPIRTLRYTIGPITVKGKEAVAPVTESIVWSYAAGNGVHDRYEKVSKLRSTWRRTRAGWRLQLEEELEETRNYKNGKIDE